MSIQIKLVETREELRKWQRKVLPSIRQRVKILLCIQERSESKPRQIDIANELGVNVKTVAHCCKLYQAGGLKAVLAETRGASKAPLFSKAEHEQLAAILTNPTNRLQGYVELVSWVKTALGKEVVYISLLKYVQRHFHTKIKVARKSHLKKDLTAVSTFKKTLQAN